nr:DUF1120 domain-containing protein [uncultured Cupriavidus sp.]
MKYSYSRSFLYLFWVVATGAASMDATAATAAAVAAKVHVSVKGKVPPPACAVALTDNGLVDFGTMSSRLLTTIHESEPFYIAPMRVHMTLTCTAPTAIGFRIIDNRPGTVPRAANVMRGHGVVAYGLGKFAGKQIGGFVLTIGRPQINGGDYAHILLRTGMDERWNNLGKYAHINCTPNLYMAWTTNMGTAPGAYSTIRLPIVVMPVIGPRRDLPPLTSSIPLDGSVTFAFQYL